MVITIFVKSLSCFGFFALDLVILLNLLRIKYEVKARCGVLGFAIGLFALPLTGTLLPAFKMAFQPYQYSTFPLALSLSLSLSHHLD